MNRLLKWIILEARHEDWERLWAVFQPRKKWSQKFDFGKLHNFVVFLGIGIRSERNFLLFGIGQRKIREEERADTALGSKGDSLGVKISLLQYLTLIVNLIQIVCYEVIFTFLKNSSFVICDFFDRVSQQLDVIQTQRGHSNASGRPKAFSSWLI